MELGSGWYKSTLGHSYRLLSRSYIEKLIFMLQESLIKTSLPEKFVLN